LWRKIEGIMAVAEVFLAVAFGILSIMELLPS
jgi:hypothetical protein